MQTRRRLHVLQDVLLASCLVALGLAEVWVPLPSVVGEGSPAATSVLVLVVGVALALRRAYPLPVLLVILATGPLVYPFAPVHVTFWGGLVPMLVGVYSVARHCASPRAWAGAGATAALLVFLDLTVPELQSIGEIAFHWGTSALVFGLGRALYAAAVRAEASQLRASAAEAAAAAQTTAALAEERSRIARELHDVVAHAVSVMVVQAGAAEQVVEEDPEYTLAALRRIRVTGQEALGELRRVLDMLRDSHEVGATAPQPGLARLLDLLEEVAVGPLRVDLEVQGRPVTLPAGLDLTAYRIVQEALTNVRRHAGASRAHVVLRYDEETLELEVTDDGCGLRADAPRSQGQGLVGMRERVSLYGGRLETASAEPGFRVWVSLPMAAP